MAWSEVKYAINSTLGTEDFTSLDVLFGGCEIFTESGSFNVPKGVRTVYLTACAAGGAGENGDGYSGGCGGDRGEYVIHRKIDTTSIDTISFTIGKGVEGGNGESTIINNIVTLAGGSKGSVSNQNSGAGADVATSSTSESYFTPGGSGGASLLSGGGSPKGESATSTNGTAASGGGGAACLGPGGRGATDSTNRGRGYAVRQAEKGGYGAGGGGGAAEATSAMDGAIGGDGLVMFAWGLTAFTMLKNFGGEIG